MIRSDLTAALPQALQYPTLLSEPDRSAKSGADLTPIPQIEPVSPKPIEAFRVGGLLSSGNIGAILESSGEPVRDLNSVKTSLGNREWLSEAIRRSKAEYADGGVSNSLTDKFTQQDVDTVKSMTGWNLVVLNGLTAVVDDNGNPPPDDAARQVQLLVGDIEVGRTSGSLSGELTPDYLRGALEKYASKDNMLIQGWLDKISASEKKDSFSKTD